MFFFFRFGFTPCGPKCRQRRVGRRGLRDTKWHPSCQMELFFRWSDIPIDSCPFNHCLSQANSCIVLKDVLKKKWTLTGTVGSGGFGLIYFAEEQVELAPSCRNQNRISHFQGGEGRQCVVKIEPHENGPLFVEWHYYLAAGR